MARATTRNHQKRQNKRALDLIAKKVGVLVIEQESTESLGRELDSVDCPMVERRKATMAEIPERPT
jgi:hypothetical protein